jgi:hypothetical protein
LTAGEVIRDLEAAGVQLWLEGDRVRWRRGARVPRALLAAAGEHRDSIRRYLARCCGSCRLSRPVMLLIDVDVEPWWLCSRCFCDGRVDPPGTST